MAFYEGEGVPVYEEFTWISTKDPEGVFIAAGQRAFSFSSIDEDLEVLAIELSAEYCGGVDSDNDGVGDGCDKCPGVDDATADLDGDQQCSPNDNCPADYNPQQEDQDGDGVGDACDPCIDSTGSSDPDGDGLCALDNCPNDFNRDQEDLDQDGVGDVCDADQDGDGMDDTEDGCPRTWDGGLDSDGDGLPDACDCYPTVGTTNPDYCDILQYRDLSRAMDGSLNGVIQALEFLRGPLSPFDAPWSIFEGCTGVSRLLETTTGYNAGIAYFENHYGQPTPEAIARAMATDTGLSDWSASLDAETLTRWVDERISKPERSIPCLP
jgi:hypothetical protein